jgi:hypothetical protein
MAMNAAPAALSRSMSLACSVTCADMGNSGGGNEFCLECLSIATKTTSVSPSGADLTARPRS